MLVNLDFLLEISFIRKDLDSNFVELSKINTTLAQLQIIAKALKVKLTYLLKEL